jgi:hypothetical protein
MFIGLARQTFSNVGCNIRSHFRPVETGYDGYGGYVHAYMAGEAGVLVFIDEFVPP